MKSFSWYLETLVPEMWNLSTLAAFGTVKLSGHDLCLDAFLGAEPRIYPCHGLTPQRFMYRQAIHVKMYYFIKQILVLIIQSSTNKVVGIFSQKNEPKLSKMQVELTKQASLENILI